MIHHARRVLALRPPGRQDPVPEKRHLLLKRAFSVHHSVQPPTVPDRAVILVCGEVRIEASQQVILDLRETLRIDQIVDDLVIRFLGVAFYFGPVSAKSCAAQQVSNQVQVGLGLSKYHLIYLLDFRSQMVCLHFNSES